MRIAVAGGTGRVGRHIVDVLEAGGHDVVPMSRSRGVDLITGANLAEKLQDVECVVDASNSPSPDPESASSFVTIASRNLQAASAKAGVQQMIVVSIIGVDRFTAGYMAAKFAHERALSAGPTPVRILRSAQFHELVQPLIEWGRQGDVSYVPQMYTNLVAARVVAQAVAALAVDSRSSPDPAGAPIPEIAGPRAESLVEAAKRFVERRGDLIRIEGAVNKDDPDFMLYETGALLPGPEAQLVGPAFDEWLESNVPPRQAVTAPSAVR